jgi:glycine oxidase
LAGSTDPRRIVVVGGGVIGLAVARTLAGRAVEVTLIDERRAGAASWAAAGMLSPLAETARAGPLYDLADASLDLYPEFVAAIEAESGTAVEFRAAGKLHVAVRDTDLADLERLGAAPGARRFGVERLTGDDARRREPALAAGICAAVLVRRDYRVDNRRLHTALRAAAERCGVRMIAGRVTACASSAGRVHAVDLADDTRVAADAVVLAGGAWSDIAGVTAAPIRPVRGQMLAVRGEATPFERVIASPRCYLIPRADGRVLVGATVEDVGFVQGTTPTAVAELRAAAIEIAPGLAALPVVEQWFGFRPGTPDGLPVLGEDDEVSGVFHATGHYRNGILLAPITAQLVTAALFGDAPSVSLEPFSIRRFR